MIPAVFFEKNVSKLVFVLQPIISNCEVSSMSYRTVFRLYLIWTKLKIGLVEKRIQYFKLSPLPKNIDSSKKYLSSTTDWSNIEELIFATKLMTMEILKSGAFLVRLSSHTMHLATNYKNPSHLSGPKT